jgi:hypothetical protein
MPLLAPLAPLPRTEAQFQASAIVSTAGWFAVLVLLAAVVTGWWAAPRRRLATSIAAAFAVAMACNLLDAMVAADVAKAWFGALAGVAFVRAIERPWWLLPICVLVPAADAWSVFSSRGVTHAVIDRAAEEPRWIEWPTIGTPIVGMPYEAFGRIGTVDVLFIALMVAVARRWQLGVVRTAIALWAGMVATNVLVLRVEDLALPALPMLCVAFLCVQLPALVRDLRADLRSRS